jgi:peptidoglycan hydrolase-like protein with peptidoglycan-binding domain
MPAFEPRTTTTSPSADPSQTSTPLADLHTNPPKIAPTAAKQAALAAFKRKSTSLLKQRLQAQRPPQSANASNVPVAALQKILISRGIQVAPDGLYGPRTASAWSALAQRRQLPPSISRVGPKIAKVVTHTYEALSVPAIP